MSISLSAPDSSSDQAANQPSALEVVATPLPPLTDLARAWLELESRAAESFFTSWTWIGTWLTWLSDAKLPLDHLILITARKQTAIVGLGIVCPAPRKWGSIGHSRILLHQTGRVPQDSIYVEYNDFLVDAAIGLSVRMACLQFLDSQRERGRLRINAAAQSILDALTNTEIPHKLSRVETCFYADLTQVPTLASAPVGTDGRNEIGGDTLRAATNAYLTCLSSNSRQQIRRAIRLAEQHGPLRVVRAITQDDTANTFGELVRLHTAAWNKRKGLPGAFANSDQTQFVAALIDAGNASGRVDLLRIEAGTQTVGVLLNFVHRGEIYAYQSGFAYTDDNRFKPGLLCHSLAAAYYKLRGRRGYHFMAGASRYKDTLSNATETLYWLETRRGGILSHIWHRHRALRQKTQLRS
ncbi:MAG: GNAT family N-acetyltransferase [Rhodospirillaceae bacterium]|nr:MAG: GNAT family N-acetyltransferase [Rhodospirillaceae bacterium]